MPRRKGGLWLPLEVNFMEDDRIVEAGEKAAWLYLSMCLASKRLGTDGMLTSRQVERLHVAGWSQRLSVLLRLHLIEDIGADLWGIPAWLGHNDPQVKIEQLRERDRARKSGKVPSGIRPESAPTPSVEKSREEKRRTGNPPGPHGPCPGCSDADCPSRSLRVVTA